jgi:hypothetical protein
MFDNFKELHTSLYGCAAKRLTDPFRGPSIFLSHPGSQPLFIQEKVQEAGNFTMAVAH